MEIPLVARPVSGMADLAITQKRVLQYMAPDHVESFLAIKAHANA